ncbi:hypothetical protein X797_009280 [Metarhizium robertsii]|uniref:Uncharacterized protein n=2 Tax=Metarhizium robertsii TaxID=568076 RepID=E9EJN7_METRA|nr:uncharacterized protein MAA_00435 [Metarhizium robertsii ARSEF 23]EFZ03361.1 hypothetical protein MAA_00435 [Metarhizium robertsii ARSEF 23]EXU97561.1 hypothetical protein X797_009280 [Metarhizium robertsii]
MAIYTPRPFRLVTVNNAPERAKYVIGRVIDGLKDRYEIEYVGNCDGIDKIGINDFDSVALCCASMWTAEESEGMIETAKGIRPNIKTHAIPYGLQVAKGPEAIVEHLKDQIPRLLG